MSVASRSQQVSVVVSRFQQVSVVVSRSQQMSVVVSRSQQVSVGLSRFQQVSVALSWSQQVSCDFSSFFLLFLLQMAARLPPDQAAIFLSLMTMEGLSFSSDDVMEAVQLSRDFPSALKFLTHSCPICQEQVSFSKVRDASSNSANQRQRRR